MKTGVFFVALALPAFLGTAQAQGDGWKHSGSIYILTTARGADLPAGASENDFPLLVRLDKDFFDFSQAKPNGEDIRFSTSAGRDLPYQIEQWDAANGTAAIWVRIPNIKGDASQEIKLRWGKADAASESCGPAVFNESNGYVSVWHMSDPVADEVGTIVSKDEGTTATGGVIGQARHLAGKQGISGGENITNYPSGTGPMTTEAWFRAEKPNSTVLAWGKEKRPCKIMMNFLSPPRIAIQCYFADVEAKSPLAMNQWYHVVHTYANKDSRVYINGRLDGASTPVLDIPTTSSLWIGGWYKKYTFVGDVDEVRISKVVRSPDWIRLQYENQKPLQTLVGPVVRAGDAFSVTPAQATVPEGRSATLSAEAGGALKVYWTLKSDGVETLLAVDRFRLTFNAGRLTNDKAATLQFKAVYPNEVKTRDIPVALKEAVPDPVFTLKAPANWDGRERIEVTARIANLREMQAAGAGELNYQWDISGIATAREIAPGKLVLTRAQNSGTMTVTAAVENGGKPAVQSVQVLVKEPAKDAWVQRTPDKDEKPRDNQFIARDDTNEGTLYYNGTLDGPADSVFLKVYADDKLIKTETQAPKADKSYAFSVRLKAGLVKYKVEFGSRSGNAETVLHTAGNIVCGDAYMIDGQSNALATDWGKGDLLDTSQWIRSFGANGGDISKGWGNAVRRQGGHWQIGCWAMDLALRLVESEKVPICIINGAAGGTLIEAHQRNDANSTDPQTIYGRLLNRIQQARLTHGIRGVFWHQGENNQGTQGATGRYGWETYEQYFVDMSAAWKRDYPNIRHYYVFQIWPNSCGMGGNKDSDKLRDVQRTLPRLYSNMSVMSTIGVRPPGPCHYPPAGYADLARIVCPLVQRHNYGKAFDKPITAPDVKKACYAGSGKDEIVLEFDQPVAWTDSLASQFYLDDAADQVASGKASGCVITLKLKAPSTAGTIAYLKDKTWSVDNLLYGANGIAALTFRDVPISTK
jgi:hypothetical protein